MKLIIFDMDGLMFDTERVGMRACIEAGKLLNYNITEKLYIKTIATDLNIAEGYFKEELGEQFDINKLYYETRKIRDKLIEEQGILVKPGLYELIEYLEKIEVKKAVASSSRLSVINNYLKLANLSNRFDKIMSSEQFEKGKPNPEIFLKTCEELGIEPKEAMVLEDSINGLMAANNANIKCIVVPDLVEMSEGLKSKAYKIVNNLNDVPKILEKVY